MSDFRAAAEAAHGAGYTYFDQLGARAVDDRIELWLRVMDPDTFEARLIKTLVATAGDLTSVADLWAGARWAEAEIQNQFRRAGALLTPSGGVAHPGEA